MIQQHKLLSPISASLSSRKAALSYDHIILGILEDASVQAFVDTCAENLITERFVREQNLSFNTSHSSYVRIADGTSFSTLGTVTLKWQFHGEEDSNLVRFHVVPSAWRCYPVVLGGAFLWSSGTLTEHISRLRIAPRGPPTQRIFFQGGGNIRLNGLCGDRAVQMFPDLASDIPAMSTQFAQDVGVDIDTSARFQIPIELPGNRVLMTRGRVPDVTLQLGEDLYQQAFYLIDGLPGDILLDAEFLVRTNAFVKYRDHITVAQHMAGDGEGVFLVVANPPRRHWWRPKPKKREFRQIKAPRDSILTLTCTATLTPFEQDQADWKQYMLAFPGKKKKLEWELGAIVAKLDSNNDPAKQSLLEQQKKDAEERLRQEKKHYADECEKHGKREF